MALPVGKLALPSNWGIIAFLALGWTLSRLPFRSLPGAARPLGALLWRRRRLREVTLANVGACFPEMTTDARADLARRSVDASALALLQSIKVWFRYRPDHPCLKADRHEGLDHFDAALATGRGVILLNCHYGSPDLNGAFVARLPRGGRRLVGVYRRPSHDLANDIVRWGRTRLLDDAIPSRDIRRIVPELCEGNIVWIAADIETGGKGAVFSEFFGVPASTGISVARIARITGAVVLPTRHRQDPDTGEYVYEVLPPLGAFPPGDAEADAAILNRTVERLIGDDPVPYWWCIKRFRLRPPGHPPIYVPE